METISIRQMLMELESGKVGSMQFVTYNKTLNTGGKIKVIEEGYLMHKDRELGKQMRREEEAETDLPKTEIKTRNPKHYMHYTRNIHILKNGVPTGQMIKIHPPLVLIFNGKKVVP
ncbi:MAG: hypothetical protein LCH44_11110 [Bacteroidetes bacterium]|nr:hypothetical protein [Bacteroidota bacterium]